jgi:hypothetical protein
VLGHELLTSRGIEIFEVCLGDVGRTVCPGVLVDDRNRRFSRYFVA